MGEPERAFVGAHAPPTSRAPSVRPSRAARLALRVVPGVALLLAGCNVAVPRGPLADFFLKDYDLPKYRADEARVGRQQTRIQPTATSAALGGIPGAMAGGRRTSWRTASSASVGGMSGALVGGTYARIEERDPLPDTYSGTILALPIIATDPNKGPTVGLLPVAFFQESLRLTNILVPDVTWNAIDGLGGSFRVRRFFSSDSSLAADFNATSNGAFDNEIVYAQRRLGPREFLFYRAQLAYKTDLSTRFYGIGNDTEEEGESSYALRRTIAAATLGIQLPLHFTAELTERLASYKVGPGQFEDEVDSAKAKFPNVTGMRGRFDVLSHRIRLTFDTRDSRVAPTRGVFAEFTYDVGDETLGSEVGFHRFGASCVVLIPKWRKRFITVVRAGGWVVEGDDVPFYELTSIGGKNTHRGYGEGRFVDQNGWVLSVEERWNITEFVLMDVRNVFQVAGFVDVGRVFSEDEGFTIKHAKVAAGGAVRLVVPDSDIVTSIDVGFSDEGAAAFVGLDYPF